ncbi:MAG TPA: hydroxysqualene dehydroxylase HpnE [Methyloceanibacter sp.]|nr:hydroxysqualene dehydroxylase HpnE [Methyloceanibacter sp.]
MAGGTVHIVGAGLAGLSAAVGLVGSGRKIVVHEIARHAGGRCRSYFEPALGLTIDNGNHLLLSANRAALAFLKTIGSEGKLAGPPEAEFAFADLATRERWRVRPNDGPVPWWIFSKQRRVPGTRGIDYLSFAKLLRVKEDRPIGDIIACEGLLYDRFWRPVLLAALNAQPPEASSLLAAAVLRETLLKGGQACRPLVAQEGLGPAFIEPALAYLERNGVQLCFGHQLRRLRTLGNRIRTLDFGEDTVELAKNDTVILAVPAAVVALLAPVISTPQSFRAIVNAHFKFELPKSWPKIIGIVNGTAEWLFAFPGRIAATISAADRWIEAPRELMAEKIWGDIVALTGAPRAMPPWIVIKERRATFAALPEENAKRPPAETPWRNLLLAGDWTATGLPATIEGAIRSGNKAAELARIKADEGE